ncbi:hypothetical protein [Clostridium thermosuccinogenes]|jgi:hypothetical protein|nr:hypothetical protein [Pseudoclostridium thermosuccinogenes]
MNIALIKAVKQFGDKVEKGIRLIEITLYGASGSRQRERKNI